MSAHGQAHMDRQFPDGLGSEENASTRYLLWNVAWPKALFGIAWRREMMNSPRNVYRSLSHHFSKSVFFFYNNYVFVSMAVAKVLLQCNCYVDVTCDDPFFEGLHLNGPFFGSPKKIRIECCDLWTLQSVYKRWVQSFAIVVSSWHSRDAGLRLDVHIYRILSMWSLKPDSVFYLRIE